MFTSLTSLYIIHLARADFLVGDFFFTTSASRVLQLFQLSKAASNVLLHILSCGKGPSLHQVHFHKSTISAQVVSFRVISCHLDIFTATRIFSWSLSIRIGGVAHFVELLIVYLLFIVIVDLFVVFALISDYFRAVVPTFKQWTHSQSIFEWTTQPDP